MTARADIPSGIEHLKMVAKLEAATHSQSSRRLRASDAHYQLIGTALSVLYQAATCHRKCHGGPHILESLCGRMYNLAVGAYLLAERGLYHEAGSSSHRPQDEDHDGIHPGDFFSTLFGWMLDGMMSDDIKQEFVTP